MSVTVSTTFLQSNVMGSERVMDWTLSLTGTYVTGGFALTPATLGLDTIDLVLQMIDGSGAQTNGVALIAPNLTTNSWLLFGTGGSSGATFVELSNGATITGMVLRIRVWGVA